MSSDYDIEMTTDDTLELDTIIKESSSAVSPISGVKHIGDDSDHKSELEGIQTSTAIFDPPKSGEYEIYINGQTLSINVTETSAIPDSVVSRPDDDQQNNIDGSRQFGVRIEVSQDWSKIQGRISDNVNGADTAYLYNISNGNTMGSQNVDGVSTGSVFTVDLDSKLTAGNKYNFVLASDQSSWDVGLDNDGSNTHTSDDGNLSIIDGAEGATATAGNLHCIDEVGNITGI